jgi:DNA-binding IclR family transcriptional regulator
MYSQAIARSSVPMGYNSSQTVNLHAVTGHVIPARQTPEVRSRAVEIWCEQNGEHPPRDLAAHLARIRSRGYEERASYEVDGVINISVPVLDDQRRPFAVLTVSFLQKIGDPTTPATVREVLHAACVSLSEAMAASPLRQRLDLLRLLF